MGAKWLNKFQVTYGIWSSFFPFRVFLISNHDLLQRYDSLSLSRYHSYVTIWTSIFLYSLNSVHLSWSDPLIFSCPKACVNYTDVPFQPNFLLCPNTIIWVHSIITWPDSLFTWSFMLVVVIFFNSPNLHVKTHWCYQLPIYKYASFGSLSSVLTTLRQWQIQVWWGLKLTDSQESFKKADQGHKLGSPISGLKVTFFFFYRLHYFLFQMKTTWLRPIKND